MHGFEIPTESFKSLFIYRMRGIMKIQEEYERVMFMKKNNTAITNDDLVEETINIGDQQSVEEEVNKLLEEINDLAKTNTKEIIMERHIPNIEPSVSRMDILDLINKRNTTRPYIVKCKTNGDDIIAFFDNNDTAGKKLLIISEQLKNEIHEKISNKHKSKRLIINGYNCNNDTIHVKSYAETILLDTIQRNGFEANDNMLVAMCELTNPQLISICEDYQYFIGVSDKPSKCNDFTEFNDICKKYDIIRDLSFFSEKQKREIDTLIEQIKSHKAIDQKRSNRKLSHYVNIIWHRQIKASHINKNELKKSLERSIDTSNVLDLDTRDSILELLYDIKLNQGHKRAILLVGPPATGKTSLCISIAKALKYDLFSINLGGSCDAIPIRGGEAGYSNSQESTILLNIAKLRTSHCICVFEEIDKSTESQYGSPEQALLSVLDKNQDFNDACLDMYIDLSQTLIIFTANTTEGLSEAFLSRTHIIRFKRPDYEKRLHIIKTLMIPRIKNEYKGVNMSFSKKALSRIAADSNDLREINNKIESAFRHAQYCYESAASIRVNNENFSEYFKENPPVVPSFSLPDDCCGTVNAIGVSLQSYTGSITPIQVYSENDSRRYRTLHGYIDKSVNDSFNMACEALDIYISKRAIKNKSDLLHASFNALFTGDYNKAGYSCGLAFLAAIASDLYKIPLAQCAFTGAIGVTQYIMPIACVELKISIANKAGLKAIYIPYDNYTKLSSSFIKSMRIKVIPVHSTEEFLDKLLNLRLRK